MQNVPTGTHVADTTRPSLQPDICISSAIAQQYHLQALSKNLWKEAPASSWNGILYLNICPQDPFKSSMVEILIQKKLPTIGISWSLAYEVLKMCTGFRDRSFVFGRA